MAGPEVDAAPVETLSPEPLVAGGSVAVGRSSWPPSSRARRALYGGPEPDSAEDLKSIVNYRGRSLADSTTLKDCGLPARTQLHVMLRDDAGVGEIGPAALSRLLGDSLLRMVRAVGAGLDSGHQPQLIPDGMGGAYFLRDADDRNVGVFKPTDEEPYAPANPKGLAGGDGSMGALSSAKPGVNVGRAAQRECAAYLLDHGTWAGVPHTAFLWVLHTASADAAGTRLKLELKSGSFQRFVPHWCTAEDMGAGRFDVANARRIAAFDIRVCNSDRHSGNLLVQRGADRADEARQLERFEGDADDEDASGPDGLLRSAERRRGAQLPHGRAPASPQAQDLTLVPIDHGFILPHYKMLGELYFEWSSWPQAETPFSPEELEYIAALDAEADCALLRVASSLPEESLITLHLGTMVLQEGAAAGLTLQQIAGLCTRDGRVESTLEKAVAYAESRADVDGRWLHMLPSPLLGARGTGRLPTVPGSPDLGRSPEGVPIAPDVPGVEPQTSPPSSTSPVESPMPRPSAPGVTERQAWEHAFLEAARRFLAKAVAKVARSTKRKEQAAAAAAAAFGDEATLVVNGQDLGDEDEDEDNDEDEDELGPGGAGLRGEEASDAWPLAVTRPLPARDSLPLLTAWRPPGGQAHAHGGVVPPLALPRGAETKSGSFSAARASPTAPAPLNLGVGQPSGSSAPSVPKPWTRESRMEASCPRVAPSASQSTESPANSSSSAASSPGNDPNRPRIAKPAGVPRA